MVKSLKYFFGLGRLPFFLLLLFSILESIYFASVPFLAGKIFESGFKRELKLLLILFLVSLANHLLFTLVRLSKAFLEKRYLARFRYIFVKTLLEYIYLKHPIDFFLNKSNEQLAFVETRIPILIKAYTSYIQLITILFQTFTIIFVLCLVNIEMGVVIMPLVLIFFIIPIAFHKFFNKFSKESAIITQEKREKLRNLIDSYRLFVDSNLFIFFRQKLTEITKSFQRKQFKNQIKTGFLNQGISTFMQIGQILALLSAGTFLIYKNAPVSLLVMSLFYLGLGYDFASQARQSIVNIIRGSVVIKEVFLQVKTNDSMLIPEEPFTELKVKEVFFGYKSNKVIFTNLNITFKKGGKYAIVGPSGSGKSTLLHLLLGLLNPTKGKIIWNKTPLSKIDIKSLLTKISYVSNDFPIFTATTRENCNLFASLPKSDNKIKTTLKHLGLEAIELDQVISGSSISTGQKQRLSLARALLSDREILILDEAYANLDKINSDILVNLILKQSQLTFINVTHHLDNEEKYDLIINLTKVRGTDG